jgi:hypothetical protein
MVGQQTRDTYIAPLVDWDLAMHSNPPWARWRRHPLAMVALELPLELPVRHIPRVLAWAVLAPEAHSHQSPGPH